MMRRTRPVGVVGMAVVMVLTGPASWARAAAAPAVPDLAAAYGSALRGVRQARPALTVERPIRDAASDGAAPIPMETKSPDLSKLQEILAGLTGAGGVYAYSTAMKYVALAQQAVESGRAALAARDMQGAVAARSKALAYAGKAESAAKLSANLLIVTGVIAAADGAWDVVKGYQGYKAGDADASLLTELRTAMILYQIGESERAHEPVAAIARMTGFSEETIAEWLSDLARDEAELESLIAQVEGALERAGKVRDDSKTLMTEGGIKTGGGLSILHGVMALEPNAIVLGMIAYFVTSILQHRRRSGGARPPSDSVPPTEDSLKEEGAPVVP